MVRPTIKYLILVGLLKKKDCNTRIAEIESKMPSISCFSY